MAVADNARNQAALFVVTSQTKSPKQPITIAVARMTSLCVANLKSLLNCIDPRDVAAFTLRSEEPLPLNGYFDVIQRRDLPPLKWSSLKYGFNHGGYDGEEEAYS